MAKHHPAHVGLAGRFAQIAVIRRRRRAGQIVPKPSFGNFLVAASFRLKSLSMKKHVSRPLLCYSV